MGTELETRKPTRLKDFDYNKIGAYFITVCTENRENILSVIVGEGSPLPKLSCYGQIVERSINGIPEKYPTVSVDQYVIMPDHIHLLLSVSKEDGRGDPSPTMISVMGWLKYQATKEINKIRNTPGEKVFQRSFFDHIIRNRDDYNEHVKYIHENPMRWYNKHLTHEKFE